MKQQQQIKEQLAALNVLLRDPKLAVVIAAAQDAAYYVAQGKPVPVFDTNRTASVKKSFKEEKIAINVAGFYAVETGIGALVEQKGKTPLYWLQQIVNKQLDSTADLLLNRFANATWKAGQPFRSLSRISRDNFIVADLLSAAEIQKDRDQIHAAASFLLAAMKDVTGNTAAEQFKKISLLMKDKAFALQMAVHMEAAYHLALKQTPPVFVTTEEDTMLIEKNVFEEKVATNIAGFYALECGLGYFAAAENKLPADVLRSIVDGSIAAADKQLLERFANATWKAGQPFRSFDRITRDNFTPFYFLSKEEIDKDWVQITTVTKRLLQLL